MKSIISKLAVLMFVSIPVMLHAGEVEITKLLVEYEKCPMGVENGTIC